MVAVLQMMIKDYGFCDLHLMVLLDDSSIWKKKKLERGEEGWLTHF